jgi:hypothetical protein
MSHQACSHLLSFYVGGTPPEHLTTSYQADFVKLRSDLEAVSNAKGPKLSTVDPSDPTIISSLQATMRALGASLKTIKKASLGGEFIRIDSEMFHSADEVEVWIVENMGSDSACPDYFYDIISMLAALDNSSKMSNEMLGSQAGSINESQQSRSKVSSNAGCT